MSFTNIEQDIKDDVHKAVEAVHNAIHVVGEHFHNLFHTAEGQVKEDAGDVKGDVDHVMRELKAHAARLTELAEQAVEHPAMAGADVFEAVHDVQQWGGELKDEVVTDVKTEVDKVETQIAEDVHPSAV